MNPPYFPEELDELTPDEIITRMWEICSDESGEGVSIEAYHDQWWGCTAACEHGKVTGVSRGPLDVSNGFRHMFSKWLELHPKEDS